MSSTNQMKMNNKNVSSIKKPYCKVCHDAGKEEAIYTSHYVKSEPGPKGKVTCPTLLQQLCKYCSKQGHTITYCPEVKKQEKMDKKNNYTNKNTNNILPIPKLIKNNKFNILQDDSSDEEELENSKKSKSKTKNTNNKSKVKEDFPALPTSSKTLKNNNNMSLLPLSYKEAANKGHEIAVKEEILTEIYVAKKKEQEEFQKPIILVKKRKPTMLVEKKKSWAEYSSDEDDDDYDHDDYDTEYEVYESKKNRYEEEGIDLLAFNEEV